MTSAVQCNQFSPTLSPHATSDVTARSRSMSVTSSMEYANEGAFMSSSGSCAVRTDVMPSHSNYDVTFPPCAGAKDAKADFTMTSSPKTSSFEDNDVNMTQSLAKNTCRTDQDDVTKGKMVEIKSEPGKLYRVENFLRNNF